MTIIAFVIWMLCWPISLSICSYIDSLYSKEVYTDNVKFISALLKLFIWIYVAFLIYNKI